MTTAILSTIQPVALGLEPGAGALEARARMTFRAVSR
jgi:hypothetical protein